MLQAEQSATKNALGLTEESTAAALQVVSNRVSAVESMDAVRSAQINALGQKAAAGQEELSASIAQLQGTDTLHSTDIATALSMAAAQAGTMASAAVSQQALDARVGVVGATVSGQLRSLAATEDVTEASLAAATSSAVATLAALQASETSRALSSEASTSIAARTVRPV